MLSLRPSPSSPSYRSERRKPWSWGVSHDCHELLCARRGWRRARTVARIQHYRGRLGAGHFQVGQSMRLQITNLRYLQCECIESEYYSISCDIEDFPFYSYDINSTAVQYVGANWPPWFYLFSFQGLLVRSSYVYLAIVPALSEHCALTFDCLGLLAEGLAGTECVVL